MEVIGETVKEEGGDMVVKMNVSFSVLDMGLHMEEGGERSV